VGARRLSAYSPRQGHQGLFLSSLTSILQVETARCKQNAIREFMSACSVPFGPESECWTTEHPSRVCNDMIGQQQKKKITAKTVPASTMTTPWSLARSSLAEQHLEYRVSLAGCMALRWFVGCGLRVTGLGLWVYGWNANVCFWAMRFGYPGGDRVGVRRDLSIVPQFATPARYLDIMSPMVGQVTQILSLPGASPLLNLRLPPARLLVGQEMTERTETCCRGRKAYVSLFPFSRRAVGRSVGSIKHHLTHLRLVSTRDSGQAARSLSLCLALSQIHTAPTDASFGIVRTDGTSPTHVLLLYPWRKGSEKKKAMTYARSTYNTGPALTASQNKTKKDQTKPDQVRQDKPFQSRLGKTRQAKARHHKHIQRRSPSPCE